MKMQRLHFNKMHINIIRQKALFLGAFILFQLQLNAQYIQSEEDRNYFKSQVGFPKVAMDMFISFKSSTFNLNQIPDHTASESFDELLARVEADEQDAEAHYELMFYYRANGLNAQMTYHIETAISICVEQHETAPEYENTVLLSKILTTIGRQETAAQVWNDYTQYDPNDARGWADLALIELNMLQVKEAGIHLLKAYEIDPKMEQVYILAIMHQTYIFLLENSVKEVPPLYWDFDDSFFQKAMEDHPSLELPRIAWNASRLLVVFVETALQNRSKMDKSKPFKLKINADNKKVIKELMQYMDQLKTKNHNYPYYIHKCLTLLHILNGDMQLAKDELDIAMEIAPENNELYKFVAFGYLPKQDYKSALYFFQIAIDLEQDYPSVTDLLVLARLHYENGNYTDALSILEDENNMLQAYQQQNLDWMMALTDLYFHLDYWGEACELKSIFETNQDNETVEWYSALCALVNNEENAKAKFELITNDKNHYYYTNALNLYKKLLK